MGNPTFSPNTPPRIALIIPYFGPLPPYFPVWLQSAEDNPDVDFLFYTDQDVEIDAPNFRVTKTTLDEIRQRFAQKLNRPVCLPKPYKLCDFKITYGLCFEEELRGYDFWGYCDVDLMFGQIRRFLTDERLQSYDRFFVHGHLSVYRNNEEMRHLFERPGSFFTRKEIFEAPGNVLSDEYPVINRICVRNSVRWYTAVDYAHINPIVPERLDIGLGVRNYPAQILYHLNGRVFHRYAPSQDPADVRETEVIYAHWMKRRPVPERLAAPGEATVLLPDRFLIRPPQDLTPENMLQWNPPVTAARRKECQRAHLRNVIRQFLSGNLAEKKSRLKLEAFRTMEMRLKKPPYL